MLLLSLSSEAFKAWKESLSARGVEGKVWNTLHLLVFKKMMWISAPRPPHSRVERGGTATRWGQKQRGDVPASGKVGKTGLGPRAASLLKLKALPSLEPLGPEGLSEEGPGRVKKGR